jgi:hypothetical protein
MGVGPTLPMEGRVGGEMDVGGMRGGVRGAVGGGGGRGAVGRGRGGGRRGGGDGVGAATGWRCVCLGGLRAPYRDTSLIRDSPPL